MAAWQHILNVLWTMRLQRRLGAICENIQSHSFVRFNRSGESQSAELSSAGSRRFRQQQYKLESFPCKFRSLPPCRTLTTTTDSSSDSDTIDGKEAYELYLEALQKQSEFQETHERNKSERMYQAWQRSKQQQHSNMQAGVKVVQTLAKQTRRQSNDLELLQQQAQQWLETSVRLQHPQSLVVVGNQRLDQAHDCWSRNQVQECRDLLLQALSFYQRAGELGNAEGYFNAGHLLWNGYPAEHSQPADGAIPADQYRAMQLFQKAVASGDPDAMYFVGVHKLSDESGTIAENRQGLSLIGQAAAHGHGGALYYLALLYLNGHEVLHIPACSPEEFVDRLNAAVEHRDADAMFVRAASYYHGESGYPQDYPRALADFLASAEEGNAEAAVSAGAILHQGVPGFITPNKEHGFELYQYAGELGSVEGWRNVIACYLTGEGVPQSRPAADYIAKTMLKEQDDDSSV